MSFNCFTQRKVLLFLRLTIISGLFAYVLGMIDWSQVIEIFNHINFFWIGLAFTCSFFTLIPMAKRCSYLLQAVKVHYSFLMAYRAYLSGIFVGLAMLGVVGGDVLRIFYCHRNSSAPLLLASAIIFIERLLGVVSLIILLNFGLQFMTTIELHQLKMLMLLLTLSSIVAITLFPRIINSLSSTHYCVKNKLINAMLSKINFFVEKLAPFKTMKASHLYIGLALSISAQLIDVFVTYFLALGLCFNLDLQIITIIVSLSYLLTILPIAPGGLGIREGVFVFTLTHWFGIAASEAALLAFFVFLTRVVVGLVGGATMMSSKIKVTKNLNNKPI